MITALIKSFAKYFLLIGLGVLFALLLLEIGLRAIGIQPATYLRKFSEHHESLGWVKKPNISGYFQRGDVRIHETLNSKGLRSPEYAYAKPQNTFRILFLGDSFTEGYDVEYEFLFTTILEKKLNAHFKDSIRIEIINAGSGGYSNDQEYLFYRSEGYKYMPDLVVMMMYPTNDVYYNAQGKYGNYFKPQFILREDTLELTNVPLPAPPASESFKNLLRGLALYQFALNNILSRIPDLTEKLSSLGFVSSETTEIATQKGRAPASFSIFERTPSQNTDKAWNITKRILKETNKTAERLGSAFLIFSIPDKFQIYDPIWAATQRSYNVNDSLWDRSKPETILNEFCENEKIAFINFLDSIKSTATSLPRLYNGVHWNESGNEKAADLLLNNIVSNAYIKVKN